MIGVTSSFGYRVVICMVVLIASAVWLARHADGPMGMLPGGPFRQPGEPCRNVDWNHYADVLEVELELRPHAPKSITTWSVVVDGALHIPADFLTPWKRWPHEVEQDPRVRLRAGTSVFVCRAERVEEEREISRLRAAIADKYQLAADGMAARAEVWWFRIAPR